MEYDEELDAYIAEIDSASEKIGAMVNHIDHLISWGDFLEWCQVGIEQINTRLNSIEFMAESCSHKSDGIDLAFSIGVCWIGAIATYEGHLHNLLLNALSVNSLQERIVQFCQKRIEAEKSPMKGMKSATAESVRE